MDFKKVIIRTGVGFEPGTLHEYHGELTLKSVNAHLKYLREGPNWAHACVPVAHGAYQRIDEKGILQGTPFHLTEEEKRGLGI